MAFLVLSLPRSRSAWLSRFLTYRDCYCGHEELRHMRSLDDVRAWFKLDRTGTAETGAAPWWRLLPKYATDARVVIVRRPVEEVVESLLNLDMHGVCQFDRQSLTDQMRFLDHKLDQIEARIPNVLSVGFDDLNREKVCSRVFEHCLPYQHDHEWWSRWSGENVQCSMVHLVRYVLGHREQIDRLAEQATQAIYQDFSKRRPPSIEGVNFQVERFVVFLKDGVEVLDAHCAAINERPDNWRNKNLNLLQQMDELGALQVLTARSNGRMFGYLITVISPSLEEEGRVSAVHTAFYASPEMPGLGMKMQRSALEHLRHRNVDEVFFRAGTRGNGPKMSHMYRRLGAAFDGELYRMNMKDA